MQDKTLTPTGRIGTGCPDFLLQNRDNPSQFDLSVLRMWPKIESIRETDLCNLLALDRANEMV